jgi:hypothetical protein
MPGRVFSEVQPAEVPARAAPAGVTAGRVAATKVATSRVAASASVLRLCGREETDYGQQDRKDARRPQKEGSSSGHGLATPGNPLLSYSLSGGRGSCSTICDNLREGVLVPDIYDPTLNPLYRDVLAHYGVMALPAGSKIHI